MSGLGTVNENSAMYLSIAGGFIWNRRADESDPNFATQKFTMPDGTERERKGARYSDLTGKIVGVEFRTHDEYGESVNVKVKAGDSEFVISVSTNNRYSQDLMKALLVADLNKVIYIKPYDFIGRDKKRAQGISFKQDGQKLDLKIEFPSQFKKEKDFFAPSNKKQIKRYFEDLSDWLVGEVESKVISKMEQDLPETKVSEGLGTSKEDVQKEEVKEDVEIPTPVKMRKHLKEYIEENYPDESLPKLSKDELIDWYKKSLAFEELPFEKEDDSEVENASDLDSQLDALMG